MLGFLVKSVIFLSLVKWIFGKRRHHSERFIESSPCGGRKIKISETDVAKVVKKVAAKATEWADRVERSAAATTSATSSTSSSTDDNAKTPAVSITNDYTTSHSEKKIKYTVQVPGLKPSDITLAVLDIEREVTVRGSSAVNPDVTLSVDVRIPVPRNADLGRVEASVALGLLTVAVPKTEVEGRRIVVVGGGSEDGWVNAL